jgi:hypothetical protein
LGNNTGPIKDFYEFPLLPNKGELEKEKVLGFKQKTEINYCDFEKRGNDLMVEIIRSFDSSFK